MDRFGSVRYWTPEIRIAFITSVELIDRFTYLIAADVPPVSYIPNTLYKSCT
jgi:hypothetical protein